MKMAMFVTNTTPKRRRYRVKIWWRMFRAYLPCVLFGKSSSSYPSHAKAVSPFSMEDTSTFSVTDDEEEARVWQSVEDVSELVDPPEFFWYTGGGAGNDDMSDQTIASTGRRVGCTETTSIFRPKL